MLESGIPKRNFYIFAVVGHIFTENVFINRSLNSV